MWSKPPKFTDSATGRSQIFSANGHGNALVHDVQHVFEINEAYNVPMTTNSWKSVGSHGWREFIGYIYKSDDTFHYKIKVDETATWASWYVKITYDTISKSHHVTSADTWLEGTIDVSSLTNGRIYQIKVEHTGSVSDDSWYMPYLLYHKDVDISGLSTLASFATGTTPTTSEWQALSDQIDDLHTAIIVPRLMSLYSNSHNLYNSPMYLWEGAFFHKYDTLKYKIIINGPYNSGTTTARIYVNGTLMKTYTANSHETKIYDTTLDISSLGLSDGDLYDVRIHAMYSGDNDTYDEVRVYYMMEQASLSSTPSGWTVMSTFTANQDVNGTNDVKKIRDNIEYLKGNIRGYNIVQAARDANRAWLFQSWRTFRYVGYYATEDRDITLRIYTSSGSSKTVTMPNDQNKMSGKKPMFFDLESAGCYPGMYYRIEGADWAQEFESV